MVRESGKVISMPARLDAVGRGCGHGELKRWSRLLLEYIKTLQNSTRVQQGLVVAAVCCRSCSRAVLHERIAVHYDLMVILVFFQVPTDKD